jgi:hypothetical protein
VPRWRFWLSPVLSGCSGSRSIKPHNDCVLVSIGSGNVSVEVQAFLSTNVPVPGAGFEATAASLPV